MSFHPSAVLERRREQMFPTFTTAQVEAARRFGSAPRRFEPGQVLYPIGEVGTPAMLVLQGYIEVYRRDALGNLERITCHMPAQIAGETSQLAGGPTYVEGRAGPEGCEAVPFNAAQVRALIVGNAEVGEILMRAFILRRVALIEAGAGTVLIGHEDAADSLRLQNFMRRNAVPHVLLDPATDREAQQIVERLAIREQDLPIVLCPDGSAMLRNPTERQLAKCLGLLPQFNAETTFDVAVVGAGPAGLATAVYAASEGLSVLVLDSRSFGGQAGASARIENYLGFPTGISGQALAGRAFSQAQKFGAVMAIPSEVKLLTCGMDCSPRVKAPSSPQDPPAPRRFMLTLDDDSQVRAASIVIASGARYRRPDIPDLEQYEGRGVYYWASPLEAKLCARREVALVGGGNSAGQAAVYLAGHASKVHIMVRGPGLSETMSRYLIDRIRALPNVELHTHTELRRLNGTPEEGLRSVTWRNRQTGEEDDCSASHVFLFIGADPNASWLQSCHVAVDARGFIVTGAGANDNAGARTPLPLETTQPGVFAVGDVRAGSVKRVSSAVGEGAAVVAQLHSYLAQAE